MKYFILYILGIVFISMGLFYLVLSFNLFTVGYHFKDYLVYLLTHFRCYFLLLGILILTFIYIRRKNANR